MTDQPTPRTDAAQIERQEYEEATKECDRIALPERPKDAWELCRELERDLAALTCEEGELWELRQANARMRDNLASLSKLHADEMSKAQKSFERELAETAKDYHCLAELLDGHDATECRGNLVKLKEELAAERALADRLAETLRFIEEDCDWKAGGDHWHGSFGDDRIGPACDEALAAWKEARNA